MEVSTTVMGSAEQLSSGTFHRGNGPSKRNSPSQRSIKTTATSFVAEKVYQNDKLVKRERDLLVVELRVIRNLYIRNAVSCASWQRLPDKRVTTLLSGSRNLFRCGYGPSKPFWYRSYAIDIELHVIRHQFMGNG